MPFTWKYLQSRPREMDKLIQLVGTFDAYASSETDPRLKNFVQQLTQLRDDPEQANAEHIFNSGMEMLGDRMGYYRGKSKDAEVTENILKPIVGYEDLMDALDMPEPGTGAYVAESMRSRVYEEFGGDLMNPGAEQLFCDYAAFNDMVRGQPNWRRARIDQEQLEERKQDIGAELTTTSTSDFMGELSNEDRVYMIMSGEDGAGLNSFLSRKYIEGAFGRLAEYRKSAKEGGPMFPKGPEQYKIAFDMSPEELEEQRTNWVKNQIVDCDRYAAKKAEQAAEREKAKNRLDERMEVVRQELGRADNPKTRELCLAEMLYLNDVKTLASPADQLQRLDMETIRKNVMGIQQSEVFQNVFKNDLSEKVLEEAKNGKIEGLVSTWNDAAKKHAEKDGPQDRPEVEKQRNTVYQKTEHQEVEHQEVEHQEVRRTQSVRAF